MLPTIAIVLGAFVIITRLPFAIWPGKIRELGGKVLSFKPFVSMLGLLMVGLAGLIAYAGSREQYPLEFVMWVIGGLMFVFGIIYIVAPKIARDLWDSLIVPRSIRGLRVLFGAGALVGLFILVLGLTWYAQAADQAPPSRAAANGEAAEGLEKLRTRVSGLESAIEANNSQIENIQEGLSSTKKNVQTLKEQTGRLQKLLNAAREDLDELQRADEPPGGAAERPADQ
jgi:gas vesicle protein